MVHSPTQPVSPASEGVRSLGQALYFRKSIIQIKKEEGGTKYDNFLVELEFRGKAEDYTR